MKRRGFIQILSGLMGAAVIIDLNNLVQLELPKGVESRHLNFEQYL